MPLTCPACGEEHNWTAGDALLGQEPLAEVACSTPYWDLRAAVFKAAAAQDSDFTLAAVHEAGVGRYVGSLRRTGLSAPEEEEDVCWPRLKRRE